VKNNRQHKNKNINMINVIETVELKATATEAFCVVTRHNEESANDFLRWQIGIYESRPMHDPIYTPMTHPDGSPVVSADGAEQFRLLGHELNPSVCCKVFHLLGFGSSLRKATAMAASRIKK
jgi:hypothetical protein